MKTLTLLIFSVLTLYAQDQSIYTLTGKKDPRLDARYSISYVATNLKEGCGSRGYTTGTMKPSIIQRSMSVPDGNYTINLPIYMTPEEDKKGCSYRFGGLELMILRKNDDQYSRFQLLGDYKDIDYGEQKARMIYQGRKGGFRTPYFVGMTKSQTPIAFRSDKKYFRIAPETTFVCMTEDRIYDYERSTSDKATSQRMGDTDFMCTMKMKLDTEGGKYHYHECPVPAPIDSVGCFTTTNPDFGVDEIMSDTLHIDILIDESKCTALRYRANREFVVEKADFNEIIKSVTDETNSIKSFFRK